MPILQPRTIFLENHKLSCCCDCRPYFV